MLHEIIHIVIITYEHAVHHIALIIMHGYVWLCNIMHYKFIKHYSTDTDKKKSNFVKNLSWFILATPERLTS